MPLFTLARQVHSPNAVMAMANHVVLREMNTFAQLTSPGSPYFWIFVLVVVVVVLVALGTSRRRSGAMGGPVTPARTPARTGSHGLVIPLLIGLVFSGAIVAYAVSNNGRGFAGLPNSRSELPNASSCEGIPGLSVPGLQCGDPIWIHARWGGGAIGPPIDRKDITPNHWKGGLCRPNLMKLENHPRNSLQLYLTNTCAETVTFAGCVSKGSGAQPFNGFHECAQDPLQTPGSHLILWSFYGGSRAAVANTNLSLSVNIFYCSDAMRLDLLVHPFKCIG